MHQQYPYTSKIANDIGINVIVIDYIERHLNINCVNKKGADIS